MLTNPRADRVRRVARLSGRSSRLRHRQYLVEGPQAVREAVRHAAGSVRDVYLTPEAATRHPEIAEDAHRAGLHLHEGTAEVLRAMSPDAQGLLAVLELTEPPALSGLIAASGELRLVVILAEATDPGNVGTVIRAADAAGADAVVLGPGSVEVTNPKVVRSSAGSLFHLPVVTGAGLAEAATVLREAGIAVLAADGTGELDLDDLLDAAQHGGGIALAGSVADAALPAALPDLTRPTAWLFGHEARGLSPEQLALCEASVRVPLHGRAESLNLAMAATVCLYASARAQRGPADRGA